MAQEVVRMIDQNETNIGPGELWRPIIGSKSADFFGRMSDDMRKRVQSEALDVLARCSKPGQQQTRTGLVFGQVQSGKTTSFTATTTLAADNGIGLIIILGGSNSPLLDQTRIRLKEDLGLGTSTDYQKWVFVESPKLNSPEFFQLEAGVQEYLDDRNSIKVPIIVTIMKQWQHMGWLLGVLKEIGTKFPLESLPALIIDDEADQMSINVGSAEEASATYANLHAIRTQLPSHTLLQYTATPQAPLVVSTEDDLSPDFVKVLGTGNGYTGGKYFLEEHKDEFLNLIPDADLNAASPKENIESSPNSLGVAFATFLLSCALAQRGFVPEQPQLSMLIHPHQYVAPQDKFEHWINLYRDGWKEVLRIGPEEEDFADIVKLFFEPALENLKQTLEVDIELEELLVDNVQRILPQLRIIPVNQGQNNRIKFGTAPFWVLIGGQQLDRGFTIEGLCTTYMPRRLGGGNADTLEQRARFFGYKKDYAPICRAWLARDSAHAFEKYVKHEGKLRDALLEFTLSGKSLNEWRRMFFLDPSMKLTRKAVFGIELEDAFKSPWFFQEFYPELDQNFIPVDQELVRQFLGNRIFHHQPCSGQTPATTHEYYEIPLQEVMSSFLSNYKVAPADSNRFTANLIALSEIIVPDQMCHVVKMAAHDRPRRRGMNPNTGKIEVTQGRTPETGSYGGDDKVFARNQVTIQIYTHDIYDEYVRNDKLLISGAPTLAIKIPKALKQRILLEVLES